MKELKVKTCHYCFLIIPRRRRSIVIQSFVLTLLAWQRFHMIILVAAWHTMSVAPVTTILFCNHPWIPIFSMTMMITLTLTGKSPHGEDPMIIMVFIAFINRAIIIIIITTSRTSLTWQIIICQNPLPSCSRRVSLRAFQPCCTATLLIYQVLVMVRAVCGETTATTIMK